MFRAFANRTANAQSYAIPSHSVYQQTLNYCTSSQPISQRLLAIKVARLLSHTPWFVCQISAKGSKALLLPFLRTPGIRFRSGVQLAYNRKRNDMEPLQALVK
jgi:hypothetical protein